jgi:penicillin-binding protein 2
VYFYTGGLNFWKLYRDGDHQRGLAIQQVARELGFGKDTGIELDEATGRIPDPAWKSAFAKANYTGDARRDNATWYPADNIFTAVGQGALVVTPLQLADAYAAFANGGTVWTPHVGGRVRDSMTKREVWRYPPKARGRVSIPEFTRAQMLNGFKGVVNARGGTAVAAFQGLTVPVAGKTGTAQVGGNDPATKKAPTSVFAAFWPADTPQYVAVAFVEEAGHGADIAAPIVRQVIEQMNGIKPTPMVARKGTD